MRSCLDPGELSGRVTFITGPERQCGKTSLLNAALASLRNSGERAAFFGIGLEGEARGEAGLPGKTRIDCEAGEVFVSSERYLKAMCPLPEILDVVPGSTALGRLAIARAAGGGPVALVGPERNEYAAWIVERIRSEGWARTVLVDGSMNRITQAASFAGARFLFSLRVSDSSLDREVERICRLYRLLSLRPLSGLSEEESGEAYRVGGALTQEVADLVPEGRHRVIVDDFTKVFLRGSELRAFLRNHELCVKSPIEFGGFVVILREIPEGRFLEALAASASAAGLDARALLGLVSLNPYLAPPGREAVR